VYQQPTKGHRKLVPLLQDMIRHQLSLGTNYSSDWAALTKAHFDIYRTTTQFLSAFPASTTTGTTATSGYTPRPKDAAAEFKKGIKRDPNLFPTLKKDNQWDGYHHTLHAQTHAQDVSQVIGTSYVPTTTKDIVLFAEKQKYMYAVFERTLLTDKGKMIVRRHALDGDAQEVYKKLKTHATTSTKALMDALTLLEYITSAKLGTGSWRGSTDGFVLHWNEQVHIYHYLKESKDHFNGNMLRIMLQNAVTCISELRQVKTDADQHRTHSGTDLTFEQYSTLLESATIGYNAQFVRTHPTRPKRTSVNLHDLEYTHEEDDDPPWDSYDTAFDIDSPHGTLQAHAHHHQQQRRPKRPFPQGSRMPISRWKSLSNSAKKTWDSLGDGDKAKILALQKDPSPASNDQISALLHECDIHTDDIPDDTSDLITMVTKSNTTRNGSKHTHPGDLCKVFSTAEGNKDGKEEEAVINGKKYRQVSIHVTFSVSSHERKKRSSLIDRGANGGIAGSDVRVINRHPHQHIDIWGIDDHKISSIPIVTAGALATSPRGPVILIMHQYAYHGKEKMIHSSARLKSFDNDVNDRSIKIQGGLQRIKTLVGYIFPLSIKEGLPYLNMWPYMDAEFDELPHVVVMASDVDWDPSVLDHDPTTDPNWADAVSGLEDDPTTNLFDEFGDYRGRYEVSNTVTWNEDVEYIVQEMCSFETRDEIVDLCLDHAHSIRIQDMEDPYFVIFMNENLHDEFPYYLTTEHEQKYSFRWSGNDHGKIRRIMCQVF
jgi:hypothetical protein